LPFGGRRLHANSYFSKVPTLATQCQCHNRRSLSDDGRNGSRRHGELEHRTADARDANALGERARYFPPDYGGKRLFLFQASGPRRDLRIALEDIGNRG